MSTGDRYKTISNPKSIKKIIQKKAVNHETQFNEGSTHSSGYYYKLLTKSYY